MEGIFSGEITVTSNLFLKLADDSFLRFTGLDMNASAAAVFSEEDVTTIKNAFRPSDGDYSVILHLRRKDGVFCVCLASFHVFFESEEMLLRIKISDLNELRSAKNEVNELRKIADAYFDILGGIMLRYIRATGFFEIFYINDSHRRVLFDVFAHGKTGAKGVYDFADCRYGTVDLRYDELGERYGSRTARTRRNFHKFRRNALMGISLLCSG